MSTQITRTTAIVRSPRVMQVEGIFDLPLTNDSTVSWTVDLPLEAQKWNVGLIVGPSGAGKSTIARERWPIELDRRFDWPDDRSILDGFPESMGVREVTDLLSSVGFSTPPAWLRPYGVLSNGEQFRVTVARHLAETAPGQVAVVDEFTSVVDRTVARIGSAAIAKTVRRRDQQFVAVGCHYDVIDWLQPDWLYEPHTGEFTWRSVQPRPGVEVELVRADYSVWRAFAPHHYLSADLSKAAHRWLALIDGIHPAVFVGVLPMPSGMMDNAWRISRTVCLPDYQGIGLGQAVKAHVAGIYGAAGRSIYATSAHPANVHAMARSSNWQMVRNMGRNPGRDVGAMKGTTRLANFRYTAGFRYVGPPAPGPLADQLVARLGPPLVRRPKAGQTQKDVKKTGYNLGNSRKVVGKKKPGK